MGYQSSQTVNQDTSGMNQEEHSQQNSPTLSTIESCKFEAETAIRENSAAFSPSSVDVTNQIYENELQDDSMIHPAIYASSSKNHNSFINAQLLPRQNSFSNSQTLFSSDGKELSTLSDEIHPNFETFGIIEKSPPRSKILTPLSRGNSQRVIEGAVKNYSPKNSNINSLSNVPNQSIYQKQNQISNTKNIMKNNATNVCIESSQCTQNEPKQFHDQFKGTLSPKNGDQANCTISQNDRFSNDSLASIFRPEEDRATPSKYNYTSPQRRSRQNLLINNNITSKESQASSLTNLQVTNNEYESNPQELGATHKISTELRLDQVIDSSNIMEKNQFLQLTDEEKYEMYLQLAMKNSKSEEPIHPQSSLNKVIVLNPKVVDPMEDSLSKLHKKAMYENRILKHDLEILKMKIVDREKELERLKNFLCKYIDNPFDNPFIDPNMSNRMLAL